MLDGSQSHGYATWTVVVQRNLRVQIKQQSVLNLDDGEKLEKKLDNWFADREFSLASMNP